MRLFRSAPPPRQWTLDECVTATIGVHFPGLDETEAAWARHVMMEHVQKRDAAQPTDGYSDLLMGRCPIGLDDNSSFCSYSTCARCLAEYAKQGELRPLEAYTRRSAEDIHD